MHVCICVCVCVCVSVRERERDFNTKLYDEILRCLLPFSFCVLCLILGNLGNTANEVTSLSVSLLTSSESEHCKMSVSRKFCVFFVIDAHNGVLCGRNPSKGYVVGVGSVTWKFERTPLAAAVWMLLFVVCATVVVGLRRSCCAKTT